MDVGSSRDSDRLHGFGEYDVLIEEQIPQYTFKSGVDLYYAPFEVDKQIREILDRPRICDEEKFLIDTYEKGRIKSSDLSKARKIIEETLEQTKQNNINNKNDWEETQWL